MATSVTLWFVFPMAFFHVPNQCLIHLKLIFINSSHSYETEIHTDSDSRNDPLICVDDKQKCFVKLWLIKKGVRVKYT